MVNTDHIKVGEEYVDEENNIWLKVSDKVYVENTPISLTEALKDSNSIDALFWIIKLLTEEVHANQ